MHEQRHDWLLLRMGILRATAAQQDAESALAAAASALRDACCDPGAVVVLATAAPPKQQPQPAGGPGGCAGVAGAAAADLHNPAPALFEAAASSVSAAERLRKLLCSSPESPTVVESRSPSSGGGTRGWSPPGTGLGSPLWARVSGGGEQAALAARRRSSDTAGAGEPAARRSQSGESSSAAGAVAAASGRATEGSGDSPRSLPRTPEWCRSHAFLWRSLRRSGAPSGEWSGGDSPPLPGAAALFGDLSGDTSDDTISPAPNGAAVTSLAFLKQRARQGELQIVRSEEMEGGVAAFADWRTGARRRGPSAEGKQQQRGGAGDDGCGGGRAVEQVGMRATSCLLAVPGDETSVFCMVVQLLDGRARPPPRPPSLRTHAELAAAGSYRIVRVRERGAAGCPIHTAVSVCPSAGRTWTWRTSSRTWCPCSRSTASASSSGRRRSACRPRRAAARRAPGRGCGRRPGEAHWSRHTRAKR